MKHWISAICVAVVYLAVSFAFHGWAWSWLIWFVYAGYRFGMRKG